MNAITTRIGISNPWLLEVRQHGRKPIKGFSFLLHGMERLTQDTNKWRERTVLVEGMDSLNEPLHRATFVIKRYDQMPCFMNSGN
jgi:hypothetical protein